VHSFRRGWHSELLVLFFSDILTLPSKRPQFKQLQEFKSTATSDLKNRHGKRYAKLTDRVILLLVISCIIAMIELLLPPKADEPGGGGSGSSGEGGGSAAAPADREWSWDEEGDERRRRWWQLRSGGPVSQPRGGAGGRQEEGGFAGGGSGAVAAVAADDETSVVDLRSDLVISDPAGGQEDEGQRGRWFGSFGWPWQQQDGRGGGGEAGEEGEQQRKQWGWNPGNARRHGRHSSGRTAAAAGAEEVA